MSRGRANFAQLIIEVPMVIVNQSFGTDFPSGLYSAIYFGQYIVSTQGFADV
jgi:hypothetical protein